MGTPKKAFSGEPIIKMVSPVYAVLQQDLTYWDGSSRPHTAKRGFKTNGMSGGHALMFVGTSPFGRGLKAAIIHDWYWDKAKDLPERKDRLHLRKKADLLFRQMLGACGFGIVRRRIMYRIVRIASSFRR